ncbi:MAG: hypothetical protein Q8L48_23220 [Archangium sp.]|nr:hypothetical protein [Archangium sp.]
MRVAGQISRTVNLPDEFGRWFDLEELRDDRNGLRVLLRSRNGRLLWLSFGEALAYRTCEEGAYPELSGMIGRAASGLAVLKGASWAEEYVEFGGGLRTRDEFTHWAIGASNYLIEVLCLEDPVIQPTGDH